MKEQTVTPESIATRIVVDSFNLLDEAPIGSVMAFNDGYGNEMTYTKVSDGWYEHETKDTFKPEDYDYFSFKGENIIVSVPLDSNFAQTTCCGGSCPCGENKQDGSDEAAVGKEEFVPLFPNDPEDENRVTPRGDILREAEHLITGDRNVTYGSPTENFQNIGQMWTTRLRHKLGPGQEITPSDVADLMVLVKVARNAANPKRDNFTDMAGYAACGYEAYLNEQ